ncbi:MAG: Hsp20/alpha crystallin family protein [Synechococcus sp.]
MALARWEPFREMYGLQRDMNRWFDDMFTSFGPLEKAEKAFMPSAELEETDTSYILKLEVPGIDPKDIDIEVTKDTVSISGERKSERRAEEGGITRTEFHYGHFRRVIPLLGNIDNQSVAADYQDGILSLTLPKIESEARKSVKVSVH